MQSIISPEKRAELIARYHPKTKQGLVRTLVLLVVGIIIISVLGFDIRAAVEHPQTQTNFSYLGKMLIDVWDNYLASIWAVVWNIVGPVFEWFWGNMKNFNWTDFNQQGVDFINSAPKLPSVDGNL